MLQKPFNISVRGQTLDSSSPILVTWQVTGDLSAAYQVRIYKNSDNSLVYDSTKITSFATSHTIPSSSIPNGQEYKIQITIWNQANESISSDNEIFQTSSRPVITMSTIPLITSPSYSFTANYTQAELIASRSWIVYLYNEDKIKIAESNISTSPVISYIFTELQSNTDYYIEFQVTSAKGLTGTTGLVSFAVSYTQPDIKINLTAENTDDAGIKIAWKTIQVIGKTESPPIYLDNDFIDLKNDKFYLDESSEFTIDQDFTIKMWMKDMSPNVDLLVLRNSYGEINLQYWEEDLRFHLFKDMYGYKSHYVSSQVQGFSFFCCVQQVNSEMNIFAELYNDTSIHFAHINNMGIYSSEPLLGSIIDPIMRISDYDATTYTVDSNNMRISSSVLMNGTALNLNLALSNNT